MVAARRRQRYRGVSGKVVMRRPDELTPHPRNSRTHTEVQVVQVGASMKRFGFNAPVLVKGALIVAGHARVLAAIHIGMEQVPTIDVSHMTDDEARAYLIADNRHAENAGWDIDVLTAEAADMLEMGVSHDEMGFDGTEGYLGIVTGTGGTDPDEVPETPADPTSKLGDVWECGNHRIMCGDATNPEDVARLLDGVKPFMMVTDPPYGVSYDPAWRNRSDRASGKPYGARSVGRVTNDDRFDWSEAYKHFEGDVIYVWHAATYGGDVRDSLTEVELLTRTQIVWNKKVHVIGRGAYHWKHETCWYAVRKGKKADWVGGRKQTTVWELPNASGFGGDKEDGKTNHSTQKPVELFERPMRNHGERGRYIYDPFVGSGTAVIAAERSGWKCLAMDIDPTYVDVAVKRWENFTGEKATLARAPTAPRHRVRTSGEAS